MYLYVFSGRYKHTSFYYRILKWQDIDNCLTTKFIFLHFFSLEFSCCWYFLWFNTKNTRINQLCDFKLKTTITCSVRLMITVPYNNPKHVGLGIRVVSPRWPVRPGSFRPADLFAPGRFAPESESIRPEKWVDSPHLIAIIL